MELVGPVDSVGPSLQGVDEMIDIFGFQIDRVTLTLLFKAAVVFYILVSWSAAKEQ